MLTSIWRHMWWRGAPQISKDGSAGRGTSDVAQTRRPRLGSRDDLSHADESNQNLEDYKDAVHETRGCGIGFLLRNHGGTILLLGYRSIQPTKDCLLAETEAIYHAVEAACRFGNLNIIIESDNKSLISNLSKSEPGRGTYGNLMKAILQKASGFNSCKWIHIPRSANGSAHALASIRPAEPVVTMFPNCIPQVCFDTLVN